MTSGIYEIVNTVNGKRYIGSAACLRTRRAVHRHGLRKGTHHNEPLQRAWAKYGEAVFCFRTLIVCRKEDLILYEQRALDSIHPEYNTLTRARSSLGFQHNAATKAKLSEIAKTRPHRLGIPLSEEAKDKIRKANTGRIPTEETKTKLREARRGKTPAKGMTHTDAAKAAMSASRKGVKRPLEAVAKTAAALRGRTRTDETKQKLSSAMLGRKRDAHTVEQVAAKLRGRKRSPDAVAKMVATKAANKLNQPLRKAQTND